MMRICPKCGFAAPDDSSFCPSCGSALNTVPPEAQTPPAEAPLEAAAPVQPEPAAPAQPEAAAPAQPEAAAPAQPEAAAPAQPVPPVYGGYAAPQAGAPIPPPNAAYAAPGYAPPVYGGTPYDTGAYAAPQQPAVDETALRNAGYGAFIGAISSQRMLVLNVLLSVSGACTLLAMAMNRDSNVYGLLIELVILGVNLAAMWWMYLSGRKVAQEGGAYATGGLTMYKIYMTVFYIFIWAFCGICLLGILFAGGMLSSLIGPYLYGDASLYGYDPQMISALFGSMMVLFAILLAVVVVYSVFFFIKLRRTLNALLCSARTGLPTAFVSQFVIVSFYITGVCEAIAALISLVSIFTLGTAGFFSFAGVVLLAVYAFLLAGAMKTYQRQCNAIWQSFGLQPYMQ